MNASDFVNVVEWLTVTWGQGWIIYEYWVLEFDDWDGNVIRLLDRNLGASTTWVWVSAPIESYWYYYQRWNNYWFPTTGNIEKISTSRVNVTWYGPWNYYEADTFIAVWWMWTINRSDVNLWWKYWSNGHKKTEWLYQENVIDSQWPCPEWYHVPVLWEWEQLATLWYNVTKDANVEIGFFWDVRENSLWTSFANDFLIPFAGNRNYWTTLRRQKTTAWLQTASPDGPWGTNVRMFWVEPNAIITNNSYLRTEAMPLRCFADDYLPHKPLMISFIDNDIEVLSWSVELGSVWTGNIPTPAIKDGYEFEYRYLIWEENVPFDFENTQITEDVILYAKWSKIITVTFDVNWWNETIMTQITWKYDELMKKPEDPTRWWYKFLYRYLSWDDENNVFDFSTPITWDIILIAKWEEIKKDTPKQNRSWGGWRSWWGSSSSHGSADDNTPQRTWDTQDSSAKPQNDNNVSSWTNVKDLRWDTQDSLDKSSEWQTWSQMDTFPSPQNDKESELFDMHQRAYDNWLTIYKPWEKAKFDQPLTRQQMAKISSIFWANFLNQKADDSEWKVYECSQYTDLHKSKWEMRWYVIQSCLMKNMWYHYDNERYIAKFMPYKWVSVAEASVILSRMAWWDKYIMTPKQWYQWHMYAVYDHGLIDDISNPQREVTRWEAFMMMYRLSLLMK